MIIVPEEDVIVLSEDENGEEDQSNNSNNVQNVDGLNADGVEVDIDISEGIPVAAAAGTTVASTNEGDADESEKDIKKLVDDIVSTSINHQGGNGDGDGDDNNSSSNRSVTKGKSTSTTTHHRTAVEQIATQSPSTTKYLHLPWENLPQNVREAASLLGYSRPNWGSNSSEWAAGESQWWKNLSPKQQHCAAGVLGWDQHAWDTQYEDTWWEDLPDHVREVAQDVLGFTEEMWDGDTWPKGLDKWWCDLNGEEKLALNMMGYRQYNWE